MTKSVFISYPSTERPFATELFEAISPSYDVFMDYISVETGDEWVEELEKGVRNAACLVAVVSDQSKASKWIKRELLLADVLGKPIFPAILSGEIPFQIIDRQFVDFRGDFEPAAETLITAIAKKIGPAESSPTEVERLLGRAVRKRLNGDAVAANALLQRVRTFDKKLDFEPDELWRQIGRVGQVSMAESMAGELSVVHLAEKKGYYKSGRQRYRWTLNLVGEQALLLNVDSVQYLLHSTFKNPSKLVRNRSSSFRLALSGWGTFTVRVSATLKDGSKLSSDHSLTYGGSGTSTLT